MQCGSGDICRGGEVALFNESIQLEAFDMHGPVSSHFGFQCRDVAVGRAANLHGQFVAQFAGIGRFGDPTVEFGAPGIADRVDLLVGPTFLNHGRPENPTSSVHAREYPVDLLVRGTPEESDRLVEPARKFVTRPGELGQGDENCVFECHTNQYVREPAPMQQSDYATRCTYLSITLDEAHSPRLPVMSTPGESAVVGVATTRKQVFAWGIWDWGSAAFNAVILTFVFSVYLTDAVGDDLPGSISATSWFGWSIGLAGVVIAVLAPITGQRFDARGSRKRSLALLTGLTVACMAGLFFVEDDYHYLWLGLVLLATASILFELASVPYNAMLRQVSTPANIGRVSGFGWSMGYFGGIVLLLVCYLGFITGDGDSRGLFGITTDGGLNIRVVALVAAVWFAVSAIPVLLSVPELPKTAADPGAAKAGIRESYKVLFRDLRELWTADRRSVYFLIASALFRDGLAGVFTFGAVLAVSVYGIGTADVLLFGVAANVAAGLGAITAGRFDDRVGPKAVIVFSLAAMIVAGIALLFVSGPLLFWVFGLVLCLFVGPAQSSSRTYLARLAPPGREGQFFGLYATTGRAVSFLAPTLFGLFVWIFDADRAGIGGLLVVLAIGLGALLAVKSPDKV